MIMKNRSHKQDINRLRSRHRDKYIQNIACLGKAMPLCNKQHLSNIWGPIHWKKKLSWKQALLIKKACNETV